MFDRDVYLTLGGGNHSHHHTHNITEKRAPTDESVKLLREMEKAAKEGVHRTIRFQENNFDCMVQIYVEHHLARTMLVAKFSLNGKEMETEVEIADIFNKKPDPREVAEKLITAIARQIAADSLQPLYKALIEAHLI